MKEIYCSGGSGFDKSGWYDLFKIYGRRWVLCFQFIFPGDKCENLGVGREDKCERWQNGVGRGWGKERCWLKEGEKIERRGG